MCYLPLNDEDRAEMLARIGVDSIDDLFADIPRDKRLEQDLELPPRKSEMEVERLLSALAARNVAAGSVPFRLHDPLDAARACQALRTFTPAAAILRELIAERSRWLMVLTGMDAVALPPRAQGKACGLMVIKAAIAA